VPTQQVRQDEACGPGPDDGDLGIHGVSV
jgi:hypothetical protein